MINKQTYLGIPLARRRTRRLLVAGYWAAVVVFLALAGRWMWRDPNWTDHSFALPFGWLVALLAGFLGGTRPGGPVRDFEGRKREWPDLLDNTIRTLKSPRNREWVNEDRPLDERDIRLRNAAHYNAYSLLKWVIFFGFIFGISADLNHLLLRIKPTIIPLLGLFVLVVFNLPQSLILWFEPDMEERDER